MSRVVLPPAPATELLRPAFGRGAVVDSHMYENYFGLRQRPFNMTPDPEFLFFTEKHREAFAHLIYGINERRGFIQITGEVGAGKTTLCRALLSEFDERTRIALILNPYLSATELLRSINEELFIDAEGETNKELLDVLNRYLIEQHARGTNVVLVIDEAQNIPDETLEQIRMISNLETVKDKLIQIVLVGQPELREKLASRRMRQINQRITVRYHLAAMSRTETAQYVLHRLRVAGATNRPRFSHDALDLVYRYTGGVPRRINALCDQALLAAYVRETDVVDRALVVRAQRELAGGGAVRASVEDSRGVLRAVWAVAATMLIAVVCGAGVSRYAQQPAPVLPQTRAAATAASALALPAMAMLGDRVRAVGPASRPAVPTDTPSLRPTETPTPASTEHPTDTTVPVLSPSEPGLHTAVADEAGQAIRLYRNEPAPPASGEGTFSAVSPFTGEDRGGPPPEALSAPVIDGCFDASGVARCFAPGDTGPAAVATALARQGIATDALESVLSLLPDQRLSGLDRLAAQSGLIPLSVQLAPAKLRRLGLPAVLECAGDEHGTRVYVATWPQDGTMVVGDPLHGCRPFEPAWADRHWCGAARVYAASEAIPQWPLSAGVTSEEVRRVQQRLAALGLYRGPLHGQFDVAVGEAVEVFQRRQFLRVDGLVGRETGLFLYAASRMTDTP